MRRHEAQVLILDGCRHQLNLQPSTLSRVLRNLENRGFIERHRTTEDARSLSLSLTYLGARTAK
ncbi:MarR family transcriptional regulator, partial [Bifidobacterium breve]|nr:MarR family transcriptional regulator [Bifidobacterium breve]